MNKKNVLLGMVGIVALAVLGKLFEAAVPPVVSPIMDQIIPPKEKAPEPSPTININVPTAFQVNYLYRDPSSGVLKPILPGSVLLSETFYKIVFTPDRDGYVYIFQVDSAGQLDQLFPMERHKDVVVNNFNPVQAGKRVVLQAESMAFKLNKTTGRERIYLVVTDRPNERTKSWKPSARI